MADDRRAKFRDVMSRLDPTIDPERAVRDNLYAVPPNGIARRLSARLDIDPGSTHLVVGGTGSGKTTELVQASKMLEETGDIKCVRIDVPAVQQLDQLTKGVLLALAGVATSTLFEETLLNIKPKRAIRQICQLSNGHWFEPWDGEDHDEPDMVWAKGILSSPVTDSKIKDLAESVTELFATFPQHLVFLFDGLDRLSDIDKFTQVVFDDASLLKQCGAGVVVVGPQKVRPSIHAEVVAQFDEFHLHGASSLQRDSDRSFLVDILRKRVSDSMLPKAVASTLIDVSGGLVRDLISLARASVEEAYACGDDTVSISHVNIAAERFGKGLLLGATSLMGARLREMLPRSAGSRQDSAPKAAPAFALSSDIDVALLLARLIIEIPGTPVRFIPHPVVSMVLAGTQCKT